MVYRTSQARRRGNTSRGNTLEQIDMNLVMTGSGRFVEIQGTGEESTFSSDDLSAFLTLGQKGIAELTHIQAEALGERFEF